MTRSRRPTTVREATRPRRKPGDPIQLGRQEGPDGVWLFPVTDSDEQMMLKRARDEAMALLRPHGLGRVLRRLEEDAEYQADSRDHWRQAAERNARHARILKAKVRRLEAELTAAERRGEERTPFLWADLEKDIIARWAACGVLPKAICISDRAFIDLLGRSELDLAKNGRRYHLQGIPCYLPGQLRPECAGFGEVLFFDVEDDLPF